MNIKTEHIMHNEESWNGIFGLKRWSTEEFLKGNTGRGRVLLQVHEQVLERYMRSRKMYPYPRG